MKEESEKEKREGGRAIWDEIGVVKTTVMWKKTGKRSSLDMIKETLLNCSLFGIENSGDWKHFKIGWKTSILAAVDSVTSTDGRNDNDKTAWIYDKRDFT